MADTFSQIYIHVVFAVHGRQNLLQKPWRNLVFAYISGILTNKGLKSIIVNGIEDHVHVLFELKPRYSISDIVRDLKNQSTNFINQNDWLQFKFSWQSGFGAFSYSNSQIGSVYNYIQNQELHHQKHSFKEEYLDLLRKYDVDFSDQHLFEWID